MKDEQWQRVIDTNLSGAFHTIRRCAPAMMKARYGRIVNVSSASGHLGAPGKANYAAAKAGLVGLSRSVRARARHAWRHMQRRRPRPIDTAMTDEMPPSWSEQLKAQVPVGRFGTTARSRRWWRSCAPPPLGTSPARSCRSTVGSAWAIRLHTHTQRGRRTHPLRLRRLYT